MAQKNSDTKGENQLLISAQAQIMTFSTWPVFLQKESISNVPESTHSVDLDTMLVVVEIPWFSLRSSKVPSTELHGQSHVNTGSKHTVPATTESITRKRFSNRSTSSPDIFVEYRLQRGNISAQQRERFYSFLETIHVIIRLNSRYCFITIVDFQ